jgi:predicted ATP-grasp superfamily ATP-dependent carboligase
VVAATRVGYAVTAIDAFADKQTVDLAETTIVVKSDRYGFDAEALLAAVGQLDARQYLGFVYGSGFEAQPALLRKLAEIIPLIGNSAATVSAVKAPEVFFAVLANCNIRYPEVYDALPANFDSAVYLRKLIGGCGGAHISIDDANWASQYGNHYYQQWIDGRSISMLFVANAHRIEVVGFNEQWLSPTEKIPFRYGGAVGNVALPLKIKQQLIEAAEKLTIEFGLIGLNSLDVVVSENVAYVLEINPRLSATFDLYEGNLMDIHIKACLEGALPQHESIQQSNEANRRSNTHAIVYAATGIVVSTTFEWPSWVVDTFQSAKQQEIINILAGEPVCTVLSSADNANEAKRLAHTRVEKVQQLLQQNA